MTQLFLKLIPVPLALLFFDPVQTGFAATQVDCHAMFQKADHNSDGAVGGAESIPFVTSLVEQGEFEQSAQIVITAEQFKDRCMRDQFKDILKGE